MNVCKFEDVAEFNSSSPVRKCLNEGDQSRSMLLHLLPGQEIPQHPHPGHEIILMPQKGHATLTLDGETEIALEPGKFYAEKEGHTFGIKNNGNEPFQMLATLIRLSK
jgi:quercetin dioxygenase-like cupin family protein